MSRVVVFRSDVVLRKVAGDTLLVPLQGELANLQRLFVLNPVAEYIWERLDGQRELESIRDEVVGRFHVDEQTADTDVRAFVDELIDAGLARGAGDDERDPRAAVPR